MISMMVPGSMVLMQVEAVHAHAHGDMCCCQSLACTVYVHVACSQGRCPLLVTALELAAADIVRQVQPDQHHAIKHWSLTSTPHSVCTMRMCKDSAVQLVRSTCCIACKAKHAKQSSSRTCCHRHAMPQCAIPWS
ncbi:hypothetical protein COO60DRAFT_99976 [Scenedesmus sp. NREL 46B-D3]|nr:hypothetical protein COO60DRAFT_99976 [Scenedesmus sp. NREL 46B-D3]